MFCKTVCILYTTLNFISYTTLYIFFSNNIWLFLCFLSNCRTKYFFLPDNGVANLHQSYVKVIQKPKHFKDIPLWNQRPFWNRTQIFKYYIKVISVWKLHVRPLHVSSRPSQLSKTFLKLVWNLCRSSYNAHVVK